MSPQQNEQTKVLEQGNIFFCYRPKVNQESVQGFEDIQRFYMILGAHGKPCCRLIVIGQKQLPDVQNGTQKNWGFVEAIAQDPKELEPGLRRQTYQTKTRGEQVQPAARPIGEGVYDLVRHGDHTHLVYALELPDQGGPVQQALNIEPEGSYILSIKNPEKPSPAQAGLGEEPGSADFPQHLQQQFQDRRFIAADPPDFLNYPGVELLLIGATEDVSEELGLELHPQEETESTAEILNNLRMRKSRHPIEPLFQGEWR